MNGKKKMIIVYCVILLIIILGFILGIKTEEYSGGYTIYDYTQNNGKYYDSYDIGDRTVHKYFGWYSLHFVRNTEYYTGDIKVPDETIREGDEYYRLQNVGSSNWDSLHSVYVSEIIMSLVIIVTLLVLPIIIPVIKKSIK